MFDVLIFKNHEIFAMIVWVRINDFKKFVDLIKTEEIEIEHFEIVSFMSESMS
jgi:hypothetical protein